MQFGSFFIISIPALVLYGEGNGNPRQYSCLENPTDGGAKWATVHGVARIRHDWVTNTHTGWFYWWAIVFIISFSVFHMLFFCNMSICKIVDKIFISWVSSRIIYANFFFPLLHMGHTFLFLSISRNFCVENCIPLFPRNFLLLLLFCLL